MIQLNNSLFLQHLSKLELQSTSQKHRITEQTRRRLYKTMNISADTVLVHSGEKRAERKKAALDLLVDLCPHPHLVMTSG